MATDLGGKLARAAIVAELERNAAEREELLDKLQANRDALLAIVPRAINHRLSVRAIARHAGVKRERLHEWIAGKNSSVRRGPARATAGES